MNLRSASPPQLLDVLDKTDLAAGPDRDVRAAHDVGRRVLQINIIALDQPGRQRHHAFTGEQLLQSTPFALADDNAGAGYLVGPAWPPRADIDFVRTQPSVDIEAAFRLESQRFAFAAVNIKLASQIDRAAANAPRDVQLAK